MNSTRFVFTLLFLSLVSVSAYTQPLDTSTAIERATVERLIDVGGHNLLFKVTEGTLPAIVFESGSGLDSSEWNEIQERLGGQLSNAVVSYDRSGMGSSDLYSADYDIGMEVEALHAGLEELGLADDILYTGHSYGGFYLQLYANRYPASIHKLLFIDANTILI